VIQLEAAITWVKVEKPSFDLVGVVLSSFSIAGICVAVAFLLGLAYGGAIIWRRRTHPQPSWGDTGLQLLDSRRP
jgi:hypothetical protein